MVFQKIKLKFTNSEELKNFRKNRTYCPNLEVEENIYNTGIYLAGGGSMLRGLDKRLSQKTDLPVYIAEDPLRAVVRGTGITLKNLSRYKGVLLK